MMVSAPASRVPTKVVTDVTMTEIAGEQRLHGDGTGVDADDFRVHALFS
jgi:hypothetical protein